MCTGSVRLILNLSHVWYLGSLGGEGGGVLLGFFWLTPLGESSEEEKINEISPTIFMSVKASIQLNPCFVWVSGRKNRYSKYSKILKRDIGISD